MPALVLLTALLAQLADKPISARAIAEAYQENEVAADQAFKGNRVLLIGPVAKVWRTDPDRTPVIDLETGVDEQIASRIVCYLRKGHPLAEVARLRRGRLVTLSCMGDGQRMSIVMKDCELTK